MQAPDAPSDAADGRVTASAKYMATAASAALPPARRISRPTSAARLSSAVVAANPLMLLAFVTAERPRRLGVRPAGLVAFSALSCARSVSLKPQPASKKIPIRAALRN
jgi:hypothetical protein